MSNSYVTTMLYTENNTTLAGEKTIFAEPILVEVSNLRLISK